MRIATRRGALAAWGVALALTATVVDTARGEVCGDADGSGSVTVTDGVRVLRSAAALGDSCPTAACDVDGSGSVSVTDGVLVLRKAAGLALDERCPARDGVAAGTETVILESLPFLSAGVGLLVQQLDAAAASSEKCDNDPAGTLVTGDTSIDFVSCALGSLVFTGHLDIEAQGGTYVDLAILDPATGRTTTANGRLTYRNTGTRRIVSGAPTLDSALGRYTVTFDDLAVAANGNYVAGGVTLDVRETSLPDVATVSLVFDGDDLDHASVLVTLEAGGTRTFVFDFAKGGLSP